MAHILIPTDFSDGSLNACAYALDLYGGALNTYTLLHSYMDPLPGYAAMVDMTSVLYASSVEGLADFTTRFRALRNGADALVTTEVVYGPLGHRPARGVQTTQDRPGRDGHARCHRWRHPVRQQRG
jgi:hypothetical protein